ncbi:MAG: hypothetical protein ACLFT3_04150 [Cyclobacteriaceae bacterium]
MENLSRKWSFRIDGQKIILVKRPEEREVHVLMKIFLAKLYTPLYEDIKIEVRYAAEHRYKPDLISTDLWGKALFWGECGEVSLEKIQTLLSKYRETHFCFSKWEANPRFFEKIILDALAQVKRKRTAPVDFINFSEKDKEAISERGDVLIDWQEIYYRRW